MTRSATTRRVGDEDKNQQDEDDDDEVYQYPKTGLGPAFASIESTLRCAICGGLSDPPVALPCCQQAFCSLCIRQYLDSTTPRCPCCRTASASNKLQVSKELRSICAIWKRNRPAILAGANASAEAAASAAAAAKRDGKGAAAAAAATAGEEEEEGATSGRRRMCAVGAGQGRNGGGQLQKVYYHQTNENQLKKKLIDAGLPVGGGKAAMVARHKRLALLHAANNDREFPLPRRELIRQVASWENEKNKEKLATAKAAKSAAGGFLTSASGSGSGSGPGTRQARPAGGGTDEGASAPPEAEKIVIPKSMQAGFSALIANARKNAKKRPSPSASADDGGSASGGGADAGSSKKPRVSQEAGDGGQRGAGANPCGGSDGGGVVRSAGLVSGGLCRNGGEGVGGGSADDRNTAGAAGVRRGGAAGGAEMQILGVAGRMVRTRGPWRCVFSKGVGGSSTAPAGAAAAAPAAAAAAAAAGGARGTEEDGGDEEGRRRSPSSSPVSIGGCGNASSENGSGGGGGGGGACGDPTAARRGPDEGNRAAESSAVLAAIGGANGGARVAGGGGKEVEGVKVGEGQDETDAAAAAAPAEALLSEEGLVYLNTSTGETAREPPAELVSQAEAAESAGEYLVFIPSRAFMPAAARAAAAASRVSRSACAVETAAEGVLQVVGECCHLSVKEEAAARACDGGGTPAREASVRHRGREQQQRRGAPRDERAVEAPTPPTAVKVEAALAGTGSVSSESCGDGARGGDETWDRLSSLPMIDLSQGAASALLEVDGAGGVADGNVGGGRAGGAGVGTDAAAAWTCGRCTLVNVARRTTCAVCLGPRPSGQAAAPPSSSSSTGETGSASRRRAGSGSKLRLPRRNGKAPQSSITSFASRASPGTGENAEGVESDGGVGGSSLGATPLAEAVTAAAAINEASPSARPHPPSQAFSLTSPAPPANGFPAVRYQEPSPAADVAAAAAVPTAAEKAPHRR